jgi:hypothetical protein
LVSSLEEFQKLSEMSEDKVRNLEYYIKLVDYYRQSLELQNVQLENEDGYDRCSACGNSVYTDYSVTCECGGIYCSKCIQSEPRFRVKKEKHPHPVLDEINWECAACGTHGQVEDKKWPEMPTY